MWGRYFTDLVAVMDTGMPVGSFVGFDGMSDLEAATLLNGSSVPKVLVFLTDGGFGWDWINF